MPISASAAGSSVHHPTAMLAGAHYPSGTRHAGPRGRGTRDAGRGDAGTRGRGTRYAVRASSRSTRKTHGPGRSAGKAGEITTAQDPRRFRGLRRDPELSSSHERNGTVCAAPSRQAVTSAGAAGHASDTAVRNAVGNAVGNAAGNAARECTHQRGPGRNRTPVECVRT